MKSQEYGKKKKAQKINHGARKKTDYYNTKERLFSTGNWPWMMKEGRTQGVDVRGRKQCTGVRGEGHITQLSN